MCTCIWELPGSSLGLGTGFSDWSLRGFSQSLQKHHDIATIRRQSLSSKPFLIHSFIINPLIRHCIVPDNEKQEHV